MSSDQRGSTMLERMMSWNNPVHVPRIDCTTNADTASLGWSGMNGLTPGMIQLSLRLCRFGDAAVAYT